MRIMLGLGMHDDDTVSNLSKSFLDLHAATSNGLEPFRSVRTVKLSCYPGFLEPHSKRTPLLTCILSSTVQNQGRGSMLAAGCTALPPWRGEHLSKMESRMPAFIYQLLHLARLSPQLPHQLSRLLVRPPATISRVASQGWAILNTPPLVLLGPCTASHLRLRMSRKTSPHPSLSHTFAWTLLFLRVRLRFLTHMATKTAATSSRRVCRRRFAQSQNYKQGGIFGENGKHVGLFRGRLRNGAAKEDKERQDEGARGWKRAQRVTRGPSASQRLGACWRR